MKRIKATTEPEKLGSVVFDDRGRKYTKMYRGLGPLTGTHWQTTDKAFEFNWNGLVGGTRWLTCDPGVYGTPEPTTLLELEHG